MGDHKLFHKCRKNYARYVPPKLDLPPPPPPPSPSASEFELCFTQAFAKDKDSPLKLPKWPKAQKEPGAVRCAIEIQ